MERMRNGIFPRSTSNSLPFALRLRQQQLVCKQSGSIFLREKVAAEQSEERGKRREMKKKRKEDEKSEV